ncbi:MAG: tRNA 2-thiouridine(34) synthase MnmA [Clostridiales bacterium]|nr:tRNA 2-thiouridine(34) synthase MnmA [Clostridiales bacterium]
MKKTAAVGLSGGVDSAVAALLLREQGYDVFGITLRLKPADASDSDISDAQAVADRLGIRLIVCDKRSEFEKSVISDFVNAYARGLTPSPCVGCNQLIKFGLMADTAFEQGADFLATGHYAEIERNSNGGCTLKRAQSAKDQSYFLCRLSEKQLSKTLFPLGALSKNEVRSVAERYALPVAHKHDSQEVCFIPDNDYARFVEERLGTPVPNGNFLNSSGEVVGTHSGIIRYTIGQRKGLGAFGEPMYVTKIDAAANTVTIGKNDELFTNDITIQNISTVSGKPLPEALRCEVKIRCAAKPAPAVITPLPDRRAKIVFDLPQRAAAPGQTAAIYSGDTVLGGGEIE